MRPASILFLRIVCVLVLSSTTHPLIPSYNTILLSPYTRLTNFTFSLSLLTVQDFAPLPGTYDLIWIQWVIGHLHDLDCVRFFRRCAEGLTDTGKMHCCSVWGVLLYMCNCVVLCICMWCMYLDSVRFFRRCAALWCGCGISMYFMAHMYRCELIAIFTTPFCYTAPFTLHTCIHSRFFLTLHSTSSHYSPHHPHTFHL